MAFVESFAPFFADFGVDATLNSVPVRGIFDAAYGEAFGMISGTDPVFRLMSSVVVSNGATLVIGAETYIVIGIEPDGTGLSLLRLQKQ